MCSNLTTIMSPTILNINHVVFDFSNYVHCRWLDVTIIKHNIGRVIFCLVVLQQIFPDVPCDITYSDETATID